MRFPRLFALAAIIFHFAVCQVHSATEIPFNFADGMVWVEVRVSGKHKPLNFLLDSGAGTTVLDLSAAKRIGIKLGRAENVQGVGGRAVAFRVDDFEASANSVLIAGSVLALDLSGVSAGMHQRIDGLLGADFFQSRIVQIDYPAEKIRLFERGEVDVEHSKALPLARRNDAMCVCVSVAGGKPKWLRVDTGCSGAVEWVLTDKVAASLGQTSIGATKASARYLWTDVAIATERLSAVKVGLHERAIFPGEAGLLGNGLLSRFVVTIDAAKSRLSLVRVR